MWEAAAVSKYLWNGFLIFGKSATTTSTDTPKRNKNHQTPDSTPNHCSCQTMTQKPLVRPSDQWIASRRKKIKNRAKMAKKESSHGMANINTFFKPTNLDSVARMRRWRQDKLIHDAYYKKWRWKVQPTSRNTQQPIIGYLTLRGQLD